VNASTPFAALAGAPAPDFAAQAEPVPTTTPIPTPMRSRLLAAAAAVVLASPALAQEAPPADSTDAPNGPRKGAWSLSFTAPGYGGSGERAELGVWEMVGERTNLGLTLEVQVGGQDREDGTHDDSDATTAVGLGLAARRYAGAARGIAPYVQGRVFGRGSYARREATEYEETQRGTFAGVEAVVGAEWFPVRHFSVSGHTGARAMTARLEQDATYPDGEERETVSRYGQFGTFTSSLSVQIYF
jgi:hypothetical protein